MKTVEPFRAEAIQNQRKKISVVVAVYNIAPYLERCVDSIRSQSYRNLEIILVDDGSTDACGTMCDRFAKEDSRIVVIHKENGGLSDARNTGAKAAAGEYIAYVDGDDWIEAGMYEDMLFSMESYEADVAVCRYRCVYPDRVEDRSSNKLVIFEGREALQVYTEEREEYQIQNAAWNKLYRRDFAKDLQFPGGKWYEDIVYTAKLFARAKRCVYLDKAYYNYVLQREGSIMATGVNERILTDQMPAYFERSRFLREIGETELADCHDYFVYKRMLLTYMAFAKSKAHSPKERQQKRANKKALRDLIVSRKSHFTTAYGCRIANPNEEKKMKLFLCSPTLYRMVMALNERFIIPYKEKKILKERVSHLHVVQMMGGLGNQMFQYALYQKLKAQGKTARLEDESGYRDAGTREKHLQKAFDITYERPTAAEMRLLTDSSLKFLSRVRRKLFGRKSKSYVEKQFNYDANVFAQEAAYYEGYWQTEKYFKDIETKLREEFIFRCKIPEESKRFLDKIENCNAVSVHIRRGDYLNEAQQKVYGGICTDSYYEQAVSLMKEKVPDARFFIFTNDPVWVKAHMAGEEVEVVDCNDESAGYLDMLLMSRCKHHIIANSSFSWWGAWLNPHPDKIVIAPSKWLNGRDCSDIYTVGMLAI